MQVLVIKSSGATLVDVIVTKTVLMIAEGTTETVDVSRTVVVHDPDRTVLMNEHDLDCEIDDD